MIDITLQYIDDCPNWEKTVAHLQTLLDEGLDGRLLLQRIDTLGAANEAGFCGSPTVLIDGVDPFPQPRRGVGLACRVYVADTGAVGSPTLNQLRAAFAPRSG